MKKIKLIILLLVINISLEAKYCIQVLTSNESERGSIVAEAKNDNYNQFDDVRVETRGHYLVLRIGDYKRYSDAKNDIREVKKVQKGAYVRKCDFEEENAIYVHNTSPREDFYEQTQEVYTTPTKSYTKRVTNKTKPTVVKKKKKKELTYSYQSNDKSLWGECKKCFVPVYEEEDDSTYVELQPKQKTSTSEYVQKNKNITVKIPKKRVTKDSFWQEEKPRKKVKNRYDIDEKFLP